MVFYSGGVRHANWTAVKEESIYERKDRIRDDFLKGLEATSNGRRVISRAASPGIHKFF
jgi:hypothetical protein